MAEDARSESTDEVTELSEASLVETSLVEAALVEPGIEASLVEALVEASLVEASIEGSVGSVPSQAREEVSQTEDTSVSLVGAVGVLGEGRPRGQAQQQHSQHLEDGECPL